MKILLLTLLLTFAAFGQETGGRVLFEDKGQTSIDSKFVYSSSRGILGALEGVYLMPDGSTPDNIRYGPWYGGMIWGGYGGPGFGLFGASGEPEFYIANGGTSHTNGEGQTIPDSVFVIGGMLTGQNVRLKVISQGDDHSTYPFGIVNYSGTRTLWLIRSDGQISIDATNMPAGTTGTVVINKAVGTVNVAANESTVFVYNALVNPASQIIAIAQVTDATCYVRNVERGNSWLLIRMVAPCTNETAVMFETKN